MIGGGFAEVKINVVLGKTKWGWGLNLKIGICLRGTRCSRAVPPLADILGGGVTGQTARADLAGAAGGFSGEKSPAQRLGKAKLVFAGLFDHKVDLASIV